VAATQQEQVSAAEVLSRVREISDALTEAAKLIEAAEAKARNLVDAFDSSAGGAGLPRFEGAVYSTLTTLARNLGVDLGDDIRGDFDIDSVTIDARELVELVELAAKGGDDGR
jgi:hypothetical protein